MKRLYFGTDGVRGPFGGPLVNASFAARLGHAVALWSASAGAGAGDLVLIGRDTRASGPVLERALAAGLRTGGLRPLSLGVLPTPAVAGAVLARGARLGVVVTASHNPASDNGIKFFAPGGLKLSDAEEAAIEALLPPEAHAGGPVYDVDAPVPVAADAGAAYVAALSALLPAGALAGWRIVADTAHGATCVTTPAALRGLGAEVQVLGGAPDGANINAGVGSEHPEQLAREVVARGARLGVAHDGDGDRCILCDETGAVLDGDEILTLLALDALRRGELAADTLVVTVQSNLGVDAALRAAGGRVERTDVGDRYVLERLRACGARLGGESSGHIVNLALSPTGDGLGAALGVLALMARDGRPLSALRTALVKFPQATRNLRVAAKRPLAECAALTAEIAALEAVLGDAGRVMVRFSGTEPKLRLLAEASDEGAMRDALERLEAAARRDLDVV
jgi:phosphoglucosamine mutase